MSQNVNKKNGQPSQRPQNKRPKRNNGANSSQRRPRRARKEGKSAVSRAATSNALGIYAAQMVNPARESTLRVMPDYGHTPVCARKYTRTISVKQTDYAKLRVTMFPNLYQPGFLASHVVATIPSGGSDLVVLTGKFLASNDSVDNTTGVFDIKDAQGVSSKAAMFAVADSVPVARKGFQGLFISGSNITYILKNNSGSKIPTPNLEVLFSTATGVWTTAGTVSAIPEGKDMTGSLTVPATVFAEGPFTRIAFHISGTNSKDVEIDATLNFSNSQFTTNAATTFAPAFAEQIVDEKITHGRVTHMSMFIQNTTAEISASGTIMAARVPSNFDLGAYNGDWVRSASTLPLNRQYIGPMKTGAYAFWMPEQLDEFQIDNIAQKLNSYRDANYLVAEIPDWTAGATAEITFTWVAEFYTPNQNFEKIIPPPITSDFEMAWHLISGFPAAMCNPEHDKETRSYVDKIKSAARSLYSFYQNNKGAIDSVALAAAEALL
jgi:hypothetical protein